MPNRIDPLSLRELLRTTAPPVLLDLREEGVFEKEHLLFATHLALSQLELSIRRLVPRFSTPVVLCDGGGKGKGEGSGEDGGENTEGNTEGLAERGAERLLRFGYGDVSILVGGVAGWKAAGLAVFSGFNVPSKAFGEFVEHAYGTPSLAPEELQTLIDSGRKMVIVDSRPMEEYTRMNIPGGINVPGGELVYRAHDIAPHPGTLVVVNCAGRTRSIIGAQSLINAGIPNQVTALRNGTMGWHLAGLQLERGGTKGPPEPSSAGSELGRQAASRVAARFGVRAVDAQTLKRWEGEAHRRTLYLMDVRIPEEYQEGHLPNARSAPGGQLVQGTDTYMADRGARVVLVDTDGVRANMTASWLIQMGWRDVHVLEAWPEGAEQLTGAFSEEIPGLENIDAEHITAAGLAERIRSAAESPLVVDLAPSPVYRRGHIPGAWFAIRAQLEAARQRLPAGDSLVLTSPDGVLAKLAAGDAAESGFKNIRVLAGGTAAWTAEGLPMETGEDRMASAPDDVFAKPYDHPDRVEQHMRNYLDWEVTLVEQIEKSGEISYRIFPET